MGFGKVLLGCFLSVGGINAASAADADTQELTSMQHSVDSAIGNHDGGSGNSSGGDALGISRENSAPTSSSSSSSSNENCPTTGPATAPHGRRATLGWQSLLPGSIQ